MARHAKTRSEGSRVSFADPPWRTGRPVVRRVLQHHSLRGHARSGRPPPAEFAARSSQLFGHRGGLHIHGLFDSRLNAAAGSRLPIPPSRRCLRLACGSRSSHGANDGNRRGSRTEGENQQRRRQHSRATRTRGEPRSSRTRPASDAKEKVRRFCRKRKRCAAGSPRRRTERSAAPIMRSRSSSSGTAAQVLTWASTCRSVAGPAVPRGSNRFKSNGEQLMIRPLFLLEPVPLSLIPKRYINGI